MIDINDKKSFLKLIVLIIFFLGIAISSWYSFNWFVKSVGFVLAIGKAVMVVFTSAVFPQLVRHNWNKKPAKKSKFKHNIPSRLVAVFVLLPCALIAILFSMTTTIAGLYNANSHTIESAEAEDITTAKNNIADLVDEENRIKEQITGYQEQIKTLNDTIKSESFLMSTMSKEDWRYWTSSQNKEKAVASISELNRAIESKNTRLDEIALAKKEDRKTTVKEEVKRDDFYTWTAGVTKTDPAEVEFFMAALPAIFIDIISPIALGVLFGL